MNFFGFINKIMLHAGKLAGKCLNYGKMLAVFHFETFAKISEMGFLLREKGRSYYPRNWNYLEQLTKNTLLISLP
jgi:hypothetical protein